MTRGIFLMLGSQLIARDSEKENSLGVGIGWWTPSQKLWQTMQGESRFPKDITKRRVFLDWGEDTHSKGCWPEGHKRWASGARMEKCSWKDAVGKKLSVRQEWLPHVKVMLLHAGSLTRHLDLLLP